MTSNVRTINIYRNAPQDLVTCDICEETKPRKEFYSSVNICNRCVEEDHCMSIK